ncbi:MAG: DNA mismatch repair protein MutS, partial [Deltaproteobacteria bacterium]|nr:DNA mismatch repair protein MutS [Deltaproteobacteria bacterium]
MTTPMFEQYHALKATHPNAILFFRMGDFYEMFFEDAEAAARELDLTLTSRNKNDPNPIPMAGIPHHAAGSYIQRLVENGYRVAIAEQVEDPALAKGLVRREVVRVVTPGVVLDTAALEAKAPNWLVALCRDQGRYGLACLDLSTGDLRGTTLDALETALGEVHRMEPREALLAPELAGDAEAREALSRHEAVISEVEPEAWQATEAVRVLCETLGVGDLAGFGVVPDDPMVRAAGALVRYARDTSGGALRNVHRLHPYQVSGYMVLDDTTRRNLEITRTLLGGRRRGSLLGLLDRTATAMGGRLLREWLAFPLLEVPRIERRLSAVATLVEEPERRDALRRALKAVADIERIGARVTQGTANARDLAALRRTLDAVPEVAASLEGLPALAHRIPEDPCPDLLAELERWLVPDPPQTLTEGGLINRGCHPELDELVALSLEGMGVMTLMEGKEREQTGIPSLKIRRNRVFGYYIEITRAHLHKVPERFLRKQTLTNAERYITPELKELEEKVLGADERRKELEYQLFVELRERVAVTSPRLLALARQLAALDALSNLAEVAVRERWTRPEVDEGTAIHIRGGRHPVVEALMDEERFVPNDTSLDTEERQLIILTGPNMAGKSTVMRQVAQIVLLAQIGSFVPAEAARIGLCDRIFTRVGATDDLARGQSTFMMEMSETASILHQATGRSLVLLDEIGRGTSTYDGLSIAWAVAEDLADRVRCRALFATHYHELCELADARPAVVNQSIAVSEWGERIVFLRRLKEGGSSRSYGIQCARLAGLPEHVVERARGLLTRFEK